MNNYFKLGVGALALLMTATLPPPATAQEKPKAPQQEHCLKYEPEVVTLNGVLIEEINPGPPNFANIKEGDETVANWFLYVKTPFCLPGNKDISLMQEEEHDISKVQIVLHGRGSYRKKAQLLGRHVSVTGTLYHAHTAHHYTTILIEVYKGQDIRPLP